MEPRKLLYIDSLRGVAILLVLLVHNLYLGGDRSYFSPAVQDVLDAGQFGVQLFFMVSAYTLMASYYSRRREPLPTVNFFVRRFFRIAPMYYLAILYFTFQRFLGFSYFSTGQVQEHLSFGRLLANLFFLNGFNPYWINNYVPGGWSIAVEMTFYATLPLLCRAVRSVNGAVVLLAGSVVLRILLELLLHKTFLNTNEYLYYYFPNQLPVFSLGILAFFLVRDSFPKVSTTALSVVAGLVLLLNFTIVGPHFPVSVGFFFVLLALGRSKGGFPGSRMLAEVGKVSFSLYLVHFAIMHWITVWHFQNPVAVHSTSTAWLSFGLRFAILFLLSFAVSFACYRFVERPFQQLGKRIIARIDKRFSGDATPDLDEARPAPVVLPVSGAVNTNIQ